MMQRVKVGLHLASALDIAAYKEQADQGRAEAQEAKEQRKLDVELASNPKGNGRCRRGAEHDQH